MLHVYPDTTEALVEGKILLVTAVLLFLLNIVILRATAILCCFVTLSDQQISLIIMNTVSVQTTF